MRKVILMAALLSLAIGTDAAKVKQKARDVHSAHPRNDNIHTRSGRKRECFKHIFADFNRHFRLHFFRRYYMQNPLNQERQRWR